MKFRFPLVLALYFLVQHILIISLFILREAPEYATTIANLLDVSLKLAVIAMFYQVYHMILEIYEYSNKKKKDKK